MDQTNNKDVIINDLIKQFSEQRNSLIEMINDIEKIKTKVDTLFPEQLDNRSVFRFQEKVKAVTELFKSVLDIRKEILKSLKDEIELRNKSSKSDDDFLDDIDIKQISNRVEKLMKAKETKTAKIIELENKGERI